MEKTSGTIQNADVNQYQTPCIRINRRDLLKVATLAAGAAMVPFLLPSPGQSATTATLFQHGKRVVMKGTSTGTILSSHDEGVTWGVVADFGADCPVINVRPAPSGVYATIGHKGYSFTLHSTDGQQWTA